MKETKFKQTDIGLIPEDWVSLFFGNIGPVKMCKRVMKYQTSERGDIPFYKIGTFGKEPDAFISRELYKELKEKYSYPKKGDVLISAAGTIGRTVLFDGKDAFFQDSNIVWLENDESLVINSYLFYLYQVVEWKTENGGIVSRLYNDNFKVTPIIFPPTIEEQERIANALSQVDDLLAALDEQIEKKQLVKQGTMQQLLTGKTRLQGFKGKWKTVKLGDVLDYEQPSNYQVLSTQYLEKGVPVLTAGKTFILGYTAEKTGVYNKLPVIIFDDFVAESKYVDFPFKVKSSAVKMLKLKKEKDSLRFVYEIMQIIDFVVADHKRHWISDYSLIEIKMPEPSEQQAIANILSTMDEEIQALQEERDKYALVKQGMMQQLLTGKIRLN